ncbi:phospholipid carrier-dependent glycosyltransferase [Actinomadura fulvescens]|uniref:Polyprenol-phosphate-mannose--protein mannosyltransferase n=1 Tax=Actinomadura fulvescens TaxID=46160 RepID=A0ABP6CXW9_9ACTN
MSVMTRGERAAWLSLPRPGHRLLGWLGPLLVTAFAAFFRFDRLGEPHAVVFDETYYAKDGLALLKFGVEHSTIKDAKGKDLADPLILKGDTDGIWTDGGSFVAHPPVGKWMIAGGEWLFGMTPFGWRFAAALVGTLSVLILARVARRMTGSTLLGTAAGLLLALDGLHLVASRTAILDIFVMFWVLAAFGCLVVDRDIARARLADRVGDLRYGPGLGMRWWRLGAGVCLGLACGTKWSGVFFVVAFGVMTFLWDSGARRAAGIHRPVAGALRHDALPAFVSVAVVSAVTYVASWAGWFASDIGWGRHWADGRGGTFSFVPAPLRSLWHYHAEVMGFHTRLDDAHRYQSWPWDWPLLRRPVAFYYSEPSGCGAAKCSREILGVGTPAVWWAAIAALAVLLGWWLVHRDWRAGATLLGYGTGLLPWFYYAADDRTMFAFYATPMIPFMVLAIVLALGLLLGPAEESRRRLLGATLSGAYVLTVLANFYLLHPILTAKVITYDAWRFRIWFDTWI